MGFFDPFGRNTSGNGSGGSNVSIDTTLTQSGKAADAKVTGDKIKKIETDGVATINEVKVVGELDSVDDLKIAGKVFEVEDKDLTGEVFNDYENNIANGPYSHAEGTIYTQKDGSIATVRATGLGAHAEGRGTQSNSTGSHAEGELTMATSPGSHAEGQGACAFGPGTHAEGIGAEATSYGSHAEGSNRTYNIEDGYTYGPQAHGIGAHAEGHGLRLATQYGAHVEGGDGYQYYKTQGLTEEEIEELTSGSRGAHAMYGHAEGMDTQVIDTAAHAEGIRTEAHGLGAHAEGFSDVALGRVAGNKGTKEEIEALWKKQGAGTKFSCAFGDESHVEGGCNLATGVGAHAEGGWTLASGKKSHAEGSGTQALGEEAHAEGAGCVASGNHSHAEGAGTTASGIESHAEGSGTKATGYGAHAEGRGCESSSDASHAEGQGTIASGRSAHAEGQGARAEGESAHAEGNGSAIGFVSHAEGGATTASGDYSHAEGRSHYRQSSVIEIISATSNDEIIEAWETNRFILAKGISSHAEGEDTLALGDNSHAEGIRTIASGIGTHTEGTSTTASGDNSHAEGSGTQATGDESHAEGAGCIASGFGAHAEGIANGGPDFDGPSIASGSGAHAEGGVTLAEGLCSHAEGLGTKALGNYSHAEGTYYYTGTGASIRTTAGDAGCHAEGVGCQALYGQGGHAEGVGTAVQFGQGNHSEGCLNEIYYGTGCHAEGYQTSILGKGSSNCKGNHIEGISTNKARNIIGNDFDPSLTYDEMKSKWDSNRFSLSFGEGSHVEGRDCIAYGDYSHAEGSYTIVSGDNSHVEGYQTTASGDQSHAEGEWTLASSENQHVQGKYNVEDANDKYAFIIGNGTSSKRSNAIAIDWNGNIYVNNSTTGVNLNTVVSDIADRYTKSQTYTKTETDNAIKTKIAEVIANAPEDLNTLKEIADWIDTHSDSASAMNTAINANTEAIQNLKATSKAKLEYVTLSYPDWSNNETTVYSESIAEDSIITLNPGPSITEEQYSALSAARIIASEQGGGYLKLRALGEVTQYVDIPISILIQGNIIEAETNTITDSVTGEKYRFKISNGVMELEKI